MADYIVQEEDGVSRIELEEGGGFILLEESGESGGGWIPNGICPARRRG